jgi:hypothetical protein
MSSKPLVQQIQDDINAVIDKYRGEGLTCAEAIDAIELVKLDLYNEQVGIHGDGEV